MKQVVLFMICMLTLQSARAQYEPGATMMIAENNMMYNNTIQSFVNQNIMNDIAYRNVKGRNTTSGGKTRVNNSGPVNTAAFLFTPNGKISADVKRDIIKNLKKKNPRAGENLEAALNGNNPYPSYLRLLNTLGLDVQHNYADAFTAYMLGMWRIANGMSANPTTAQIASVRSQVATTVSVGRWADSQKQEATEYMIYDLIFANEPYEGSRKAGNKGQLQEDSDMVYYRFLKQNNIDLRKMIITENGLVKKI